MVGYSELKDKISLRQEVYKKVIRGREDLWNEYCREVKVLVRQKKLTVWKEVVKKVNVDFGKNLGVCW